MGEALAICAAALFVASSVSALRTAAWVARTALVQGTVTGSKKHFAYNDEARRATHPKVTFTAADGRERTFEDAVGTSFALPAEGTKVPVRYERDDPDKARVATLLRLWATSVALAAGGTVLFLVAVR